MIAYLRGKLLEKHPNSALLDVSGVGYGVTIPVSTYSRLGQPGDEAVLHIHTHVREDALALFGFFTAAEKGLFEKLISVSGIGPRLAVTILSGLPADELLTAIRGGDAKRLTRIPGVGRKTSERMVLELRETLGPIEEPAGEGADLSGAIERDVISAMLNLGCAKAAAEKAVRKSLSEGAGQAFEPLFRRSLDLISR